MYIKLKKLMGVFVMKNVFRLIEKVTSKARKEKTSYYCEKEGAYFSVELKKNKIGTYMTIYKNIEGFEVLKVALLYNHDNFTAFYVDITDLSFNLFEETFSEEFALTPLSYTDFLSDVSLTHNIGLVRNYN